MFLETFDLMLEARKASLYSNCKRRKIGVTLPGPHDENIWGYNNTMLGCPTCDREKCPATHAEVMAIQQAIYCKADREITKLYIWAEVPCHQCLNFIRRYSAVALIFCLSPESYFTEYPVIARRSEEISARREFAKSLGLSITELDREEILQYELSKFAEPNFEPT
jgi:deoxycytidylate deaminase